MLLIFATAVADAGPLDDHAQTRQSAHSTLSSEWVNEMQACAGSITFQPATAKPGELVTISVTITVNPSAVGRVDITTPDGTVVGSGAGGGVYQHWWTVPDAANGLQPVSFVAYPVQSEDLNPYVICSGSASLSTPEGLSAALGGNATLWVGDTGTWTATASGGAPPYTYEWSLFGEQRSDGPTNAASSTQQRKVLSAKYKNVKVTVRDESGKSASASFSTYVLGRVLAVSLSCSAEVEVGQDANYYARVSNSESEYSQYQFEFKFSDGMYRYQSGAAAFGLQRVYTTPGVVNLLAEATAMDDQSYYEQVNGAAACSTLVKPSSTQPPTPDNPCGSGSCSIGQFCCHDSSCCDAGSTCCDNGLCCANQGTCCYPSGCCPGGQTCCGSDCCPGGTQCCPGATACCPELSQCCGTGCCPAGTYCCGVGQCCKN